MITFEAFSALATGKPRIAITQQLLADRLTPVGLFESLKTEMQSGAMLESGLQKEEVGRYSFLAFGTLAELSASNGIVTQTIGAQSTVLKQHPFDALRALSKNFLITAPAGVAEAAGNAVGFLGYDAVRFFENIPDRHAHADFPDLFVRFYRTTLMFDHQQHTLQIMQVVDITNDLKKDYDQASATLQALIEKIKTPGDTTPAHISKNTNTPVETDVSDADFEKIVKQAKQYVQQGDAFQIVISRCFKKAYTATPFDIYRSLRRVSPSPYMFYLPVGDAVVVGASPERMLRVKNGELTVNPIAGTRKRSSPEQDLENAQSLLNDPKELAEHTMLVDLGRNDLGSVCEPGSVKVVEFLQVKHFSHVTHLTSLVTGKLAHNKDALDALAAVFPAGTLSGAPKVRAMEIIDELETTRRGLYGGTIFRLDPNGNMDSCIAIRMAILKSGIATVRTGAGIVYDSNPVSEMEETKQKAAAMLSALAMAEVGEI